MNIFRRKIWEAVAGIIRCSCGTLWQTVTLSASLSTPKVACGPSIIVAGGQNNTNYETSTDGVTWSGGTFPSPFGSVGDLRYLNGKFIALTTINNPASSGRVCESSNGTSWTIRSLGVLNNVAVGVAYGAGVWVVVCEDGSTQIYSSSDAATWTGRTNPAGSINVLDVVYGNGKFVATANSGGNKAITSTDGISWTSTAITLPGGGSIGKLSFVNGLFVSYGLVSGSVVFHTSTDGLTWTHVSSIANASSPPRRIEYAKGLYVGSMRFSTPSSPNNGDRIIVSKDLVTWTPIVTPGSISSFLMAYSSVLEFFFTGGFIGTNAVLKSPCDC